ncbi:HAD-IC family P-type ATPase [Rhizomonospora bruguierae]|uniref:HAD-IC family P-type ATPase n=1 Tax=Rhizomonospora bruguierae TaxID=1581705 RepID=UPI001BCF6467|nr:HAD-IC family P-type ATPase [Micromonospora sp. NBRC 107566]
MAALVRGPARAVLGLAHVASDSTGRKERPTGTPPTDDRLSIDVAGVDRPDAAEFRHELCAAVQALPGVCWAVVNAPTRRLVVGLGQPAAGCADVLAAIESVRARLPQPADPPAAEEAEAPEPPDDEAPVRRAVTALAADAAGLAMVTVGRVTGRVPGSVEAAALMAAADTQPRVRTALDRALGRPRAETVLALGNAMAQGFVGGALGLGLDVLQRLGQLAEVRARRDGWHAHRRRLHGDAERTAAAPVVVQRPRPLPDGEVERYALRSARVAAGAGVALAAGGGRRAAAIAVATLPKAAGAGREAFAAHLGRMLARRHVQVMDRQVLRRLDRVDTVVLDARVLTSGQWMVAEVRPLPGTEADQAGLRVYDLFGQSAVDGPVERDGWLLGPVDRLRLRGPTAASQRQRLRRDGAVVLGLAEDKRLRALVILSPQPAVNGDALIAAARRAKADLVFAGDRPALAAHTGGRDLPGGDRLLDTVRALQADGRVVLLVSDRAAPLGNADCGIGVDTPQGRTPWGAHLLVGADLDAAALLIDAVDAARTVCHRGVRLAAAGSAIGAVSTVTDQPDGAARRAMRAVNTAAALSLAHGAWAASALAHRPATPPLPLTPWHSLPVENALSMVDSDGDGLSTAQAHDRHRPDARVTQPPPSLLRAFAAELTNPLTPILTGGAALSAATGSAVDAGIILGASALGAGISAVQTTIADRAMADLFARSTVTATVRRDGAAARVPADELVPGDVVTLGPGDVVPADCRLIEARGLEMDESSLTGESLPVTKAAAPVVASDVSERASMVYEGTTVAAGHGAAVVVATGSGTETGRSIATAQQAAPPSGVEQRLARITRVTLPVALGSGAAVMASGLLRGQPLRQTIGTGVGLAVASVPEGLPFLASAAQTAAARRLSRRGALVRSARTIEALGRVNVLCFDKTGTLTQGHIRLAAVSDAGTTRSLADLTDRHRHILAAGLRATALPAPDQPPAQLTDRAVRAGAEQARVGADHKAPGWRVTSLVPFEASRGYHAALGGTDAGPLLSVKGAPERVLPRCTSYRDEHGGDQPLAGHVQDRVRAHLHRLTSEGYRVLAVAESDRRGDGDLTDDAVAELCFLGFLALADPVRAAAAASLARLRSAGAQIVMITGDHPSTAEAIARDLGILDGRRVVTGADIDALDDESLTALVPHTAVVARATPAHKVRVVRAFQANGRVVAMTGDGANDAAAIRLADVGIAIGRRSTPAARTAADIVITDDRLETIILALVQGRAVWRAVREALAVLVGGNLGEIGFTVLAAAVTGTSPLNARQLLLVNLLTDLAPALAIALRHPDQTSVDTLLAEGPDTSLGPALTRDIAVRAAATAAGAAVAWVPARFTGRDVRARTVALAALVGSQLGQTLIVGGRDPAVAAASLGSAAALAAVIQVPGLSQFFGCTPLGPVGWTLAAAGLTVGTGLPLLLRHVPEPARRAIEDYLDPDHLAALASRGPAADILARFRPAE